MKTMDKTMRTVGCLLVMVSLTITAHATPPTADAGEDQNAYVGNFAILYGSALGVERIGGVG